MPEARHESAARLSEAVALLESCHEFGPLVPEVRVNFGYAMDGAETAAHVAGIDGRLTVVNGMPKASGPVKLGASDHLARRIIELRKYDPNIRAALNFRWNEPLLVFMTAYCREHGLKLGAVDREEEPRELVGRDKGSMPWKVKRLVESCGNEVPPVFYETRGWGKEPLFILVGSDPMELAHRVIDIARRFAESGRTGKEEM